MSLAPWQILARMTETQVADTVIGALAELGFRTTSWQDASQQKALIRSFARAFAGGTNTLGDVLTNLIIRPAGLWQDIRGTYWYQLPRLEAVRTVRDLVLTSSASAPAHSIDPGSLFTSDGVAFEYTGAAVALAPSSTLTVSVSAVLAARAGNVPEASAVTLATPYAGVTAAWSGEPTTLGTDRESDTRYQARIDLRWAELTYSVGLRAYELWALTADGSIDRVTAWSNHPNPNEIYIAIEPGTPSQIAAADAYANARAAVNDLPSHHAANPYAQTIAASPRIKVGTTTVAQLEAVWTEYLNSMPLGGTRIAGAPAGRLLPGALERCTCELTGIESLNITEPAAPVVLAPDDYIVPTYVITPEWIP